MPNRRRHTRTRCRQHRRLEVVDRLSPQNQVLQELCFISHRLLDNVRKSFIPIVAQEHGPLQKGTVRKLCVHLIIWVYQPTTPDVGILCHEVRHRLNDRQHVAPNSITPNGNHAGKVVTATAKF